MREDSIIDSRVDEVGGEDLDSSESSQELQNSADSSLDIDSTSAVECRKSSGA